MSLEWIVIFATAPPTKVYKKEATNGMRPAQFHESTVPCKTPLPRGGGDTVALANTVIREGEAPTEPHRDIGRGL